jgi:hypothetical protein
MTGHIITGAGITLITTFLAFSTKKYLAIPVWQFCLGTGIFVASIPFYESVLGSLFSKVLNDPSLDGRGLISPFCYIILYKIIYIKLYYILYIMYILYYIYIYYIIFYILCIYYIMFIYIFIILYIYILHF